MSLESDYRKILWCSLMERISQQCFVKRTPRFAPFSIFVGENTLLKRAKKSPTVCSVVGLFSFYTRKCNRKIMINLLSCACHTTDTCTIILWLWACWTLYINFSSGFEENCEKRKYKHATPKIQDTNQIAYFDSIGWIVGEKEKFELA